MTLESDFDWVTAQYRCSLPIQFTLLQQSVEKSVAVRKQIFGGLSLDRLRFEAISDKAFAVTLSSPHYPSQPRTSLLGRPGRRNAKTVAFYLFDNRIDVVKVEQDSRNTMFKVTLELNNEGDCVFQMDGAGEFLRWQVVRKALQGLFFGET